MSQNADYERLYREAREHVGSLLTLLKHAPAGDWTRRRHAQAWLDETDEDTPNALVGGGYDKNADYVRDLRDVHAKGYRSTSDEVWRPESAICLEDRQPWPCTVVRLIEIIEAQNDSSRTERKK